LENVDVLLGMEGVSRGVEQERTVLRRALGALVSTPDIEEK
jgi:hypothetical protein